MAIIREKGSNGECEVVVRVAGFEPWDVHVRDLLSGRITLEGFLLRVLVGGFSYTDVLESARGWRTVGDTLLRLSSFYGHYPRLTSASVICIVVLYRKTMTCVSYNKAILACLRYYRFKAEAHNDAR